MKKRHPLDSSTKQHSDCGNIFVEMLIVIPVLLALTVAAFDFGREQHHENLVETAAEKAISYAAVVPLLEDIDTTNATPDQIILDIQAKATDFFDSVDIPIHIGAFEGGENWNENANNGAAPANQFINKIEVILPEDPSGEKTLAELLSEEPVIFEIESFVAKTLSGSGYSRKVVRRAAYRENSNNRTNSEDFESDAPCAGSLDSRFGFDEATGTCYCREGATGLIANGGECECGTPGQEYNEETGVCECPVAGENASHVPSSCEVQCNPGWLDSDGDGDCETCPPPRVTSGGVTGTAGACECALVDKTSCEATGGTFDNVNCVCDHCSAYGGTGAPDEFFLDDGSCRCQSATSACPALGMVIEQHNGCRCSCPPNQNFVNGQCECDRAALINFCNSQGRPVHHLDSVCGCATYNCTGREELNDEGQCYCPDHVRGSCRPNEGFSASRCTCLPVCDGSTNVNDCSCPASVRDSCTQAGTPFNATFCRCEDSCADVNPALPHYNTSTNFCECNKARYIQENPGACGGNKAWSQSACACVENTCMAMVPDVDQSTYECYCDEPSRRQACYDQGKTFNSHLCACDKDCSLWSSTPHLDAANNQCYCDADINRQECNEQGKVPQFGSCGCAETCDGNTPDLTADGLNCYCDRTPRVAACYSQGLSFDSATCDCGESCPANLTLSSDGTCVCDIDALTSTCTAQSKPVDASQCTCGASCSNGSVFDATSGECECTNPPTCTGNQVRHGSNCFCSDCPTNRINDGNNNCVCNTAISCYGIQTQNSATCLCQCPGGGVAVNEGDGCKPDSSADWIWTGSSWMKGGDFE